MYAYYSVSSECSRFLQIRIHHLYVTELKIKETVFSIHGVFMYTYYAYYFQVMEIILSIHFLIRFFHNVILNVILGQ